jgi:hypothetical protein
VYKPCASQLDTWIYKSTQYALVHACGDNISHANLRRSYVPTEQAYLVHADFAGSVHAVISQKKLVHFVKSKQPMIAWKLMKMLGIVYLRYIIRRYCLPPRCGKFLAGTEYFCLEVNLAVQILFWSTDSREILHSISR